MERMVFDLINQERLMEYPLPGKSLCEETQITQQTYKILVSKRIIITQVIVSKHMKK